MDTYRGHRELVFQVRGIALLRATMELQRPRLVMAVGKQTPRLLAEVIPGLEAWRSWSFKEFAGKRLNEAGLHTFLPRGTMLMACVVITYPGPGPQALAYQTPSPILGRADRRRS
jgi:hypothetical protein